MCLKSKYLQYCLHGLKCLTLRVDFANNFVSTAVVSNEQFLFERENCSSLHLSVKKLGSLASVLYSYGL